MRLPVRSLGWLLPLFLAGCFFHHPHPAPNQQVAPPLPPPKAQLNPTPVTLPASANTIPSQPTQNAQAPTEQTPKPHHHRKPVDKPVQETASTSAEAAPAPPSVSAIGQLSSGDPAGYRNQTVESINAIERGLNGLGRPLSDTEQKTADNIREFLKEARAALATGDVDGAHTLAVKAKVLLTELTK